MLLGSALLFLISITTNHPSNIRAIKAAYLKAKMSEEEVLFDVMNISQTEEADGDGDDNSMMGTDSENASVPSVLQHWSDYADGGSITSVSDKVTTYFPEEENMNARTNRNSGTITPESPLQLFFQKIYQPHRDQQAETQFGAEFTSNITPTATSSLGSPPKYAHIEFLSFNKEESESPEQQQASVVTTTSNNIKAKTQNPHMTLGPLKSTFV